MMDAKTHINRVIKEIHQCAHVFDFDFRVHYVPSCLNHADEPSGITPICIACYPLTSVEDGAAILWSVGW